MNINRGRQIVYIEPLCLTLTPSAVDASPYAWGSNYPQNLYPGPQKHLINPKRATDPVLPAESLCSVNSCSRPVLGLQHGNICSSPEQLSQLPLSYIHRLCSSPCHSQQDGGIKAGKFCCGISCCCSCCRQAQQILCRRSLNRGPKTRVSKRRQIF